MKSILQDEKYCFITGQTDGLHKHHVFFGQFRNVSEQNGFFVYLIPQLHNMSDSGVHFNKGFDLQLKEKCQRKYEETHTHNEFMKLIGRNYID